MSRRHILDPKTKEIIRNRLKEGETIKDLASEYKIHQGYIYRLKYAASPLPPIAEPVQRTSLDISLTYNGIASLPKINDELRDKCKKLEVTIAELNRVLQIALAVVGEK